MNTKYGFNIEPQIIASDCKRLINQLWKLIPMRENGEDWKTHLQVVIEELSGLYLVLSGDSTDFLVILSKLEGLSTKSAEDFMIYRKTIFRCIELLQGVLKDE